MGAAVRHDGMNSTATVEHFVRVAAVEFSEPSAPGTARISFPQCDARLSGADGARVGRSDRAVPGAPSPAARAVRGPPVPLLPRLVRRGRTGPDVHPHDGRPAGAAPAGPHPPRRGAGPVPSLPTTVHVGRTFQR